MAESTSHPVAVVVPALNEASNLASLVAELLPLVDHVIVVDNGSEDETSAVATEADAVVVAENNRGYGYACRAGSNQAIALGAEIIVYIDADHSSDPQQLKHLVEPILGGQADLVLGSRLLGQIEPGAMPAHQRFGNRLAAVVMRRLYDTDVTDLGPFRAIDADLLQALDLQEMTYGWPTEMMVKAANRGARIVEVPVSWRTRRSGRSKVGGTVRGSVLAAKHILGVALRYRFVR